MATRKGTIFCTRYDVPLYLWWVELILNHCRIPIYYVQNCRTKWLLEQVKSRSSHPEVFLGKGGLKICSRFTGEHPCRCAISIKLFCNAAWVFSCKFAAYFQNTFPQEHLWTAASVSLYPFIIKCVYLR